jgi:hypothetical protein
MNESADLDCRFLLRGAPAEDVFQRRLAADVRASQLSRTFRAYYRVRSLIPLRARQLLQRLRPVNVSERWCFPDEFIRDLCHAFQSPNGDWNIVDPWPDGADFAFILTHDVETADGMRRILKIAELEEELGFRSSWNIVPHKYPVDRRLLRELAERGFEIGVHGYNHDGKLFLSRTEFDRRVPGINAALRSFGAVGFRAPMVHRNLAWMQSLAIDYDASCFDVDPYQAMPGGVGGVWPFMAGKFVELPYTLPQDHTLFVALGEPSGRIWEEKLAYLVRLRGMALLITHPDYLNSSRRIDAYRRLLLTARELPGMWHALPREVAAWWRQREASSVVRQPNGDWRVVGPASDRASAATLRWDAADAAGPALLHRRRRSQIRPSAIRPAQIG